jgi:cytochrome o ubiquinol oxidase subunit 3
METTKVETTHSHTSTFGMSDKIYFGFWVYLMTDLLMFAALFATYAVLRHNSFGGPTEKEIFSLPFVLGETLLLLISSFTCGMGLIAANAKDITKTWISFLITFALGAGFLVMELSEFTHLFAEGSGYQRSAFLSAFFTLVGTHGLHIASGLFWLLLLFIYMARRGLTKNLLRKLTLFGLFWHFLDVVWIFIFTVVYLMGVAS